MNDNATAVRDILKSQYRAALAMFREGVEKCPDELWLDDKPTNAFWQTAYHTLYFTHLYLCRTDSEFQPWEEHQAGVQHEDGMTGPADPESTLPLIPDPYTREQVLAYTDWCEDSLDRMIDAIDIWSNQSGFYWYPVSKLEHQIINIRHLQHGAAQLADRLRNAIDQGVQWAGARRNQRHQETD